MNENEPLTCEVCGKNKTSGVYASSLGPVLFLKCDDCLRAGREPYGMMVASARMRHYRPSNEELAFHSKTREQFRADVARSAADPHAPRGTAAVLAERRRIRPATPEETASFLPPRMGRFVHIAEMAHLNTGDLSVDDPTLPLRAGFALAWPIAPNGEETIHSLDATGCLLSSGRLAALWMPEKWEMDVYPTGLSVGHLENWFSYVFDLFHLDDRWDRKSLPSSDSSPSYSPTPRGMVAHVYLIVRHLHELDELSSPTGRVELPIEPRVTMDRFGCLAELRDVQAFLRRTARLSPKRATSVP